MPDVAPITPGAGLGVDTDEIAFNLTGTVAKNGTTTITGTSTTFLSQLASGDVIRVPGGGGTEDRIISAIASDTSLTVTSAFANTASGQTGQRIAHRQKVQVGTASSATTSNVAAATSDTTVLATNLARNGVIIFNDSTDLAYVKYGTGASATSMTMEMGPGAYWEMPSPVYTGQINALWSGTNGSIRVTELAP